MFAQIFGILSYLYMFYIFVMSLVFVGNYASYLPPNTTFGNLDGDFASSPGRAGPPTRNAILLDSCLLGLFAIQHLVMARTFFKDWTAKHIYSARVERSAFVLAATMCLHLLMAFWVPLPTKIFTFPAPHVMKWMPAVGYLITNLATFNIDHFHLFGVKQALLAKVDNTFVAWGLYAYMRHPIMTGFFIAFWLGEHMTHGRLLFATLTTAYIVLAVYCLEEPHLVDVLGQTYMDYQAQVPAFCPALTAFRRVTSSGSSAQQQARKAVKSA